MVRSLIYQLLETESVCANVLLVITFVRRESMERIGCGLLANFKASCFF